MSDGTYLIEEHELADMEQHIDLLTRAMLSIHDLIRESGGVYGLHLNGDLTPWGDLLEGGTFEEWLIDYSKALEATDIEALDDNS